LKGAAFLGVARRYNCRVQQWTRQTTIFLYSRNKKRHLLIAGIHWWRTYV